MKLGLEIIIKGIVIGGAGKAGQENGEQKYNRGGRKEPRLSAKGAERIEGGQQPSGASVITGTVLQKKQHPQGGENQQGDLPEKGRLYGKIPQNASDQVTGSGSG